jgi:hypothetical protein
MAGQLAAQTAESWAAWSGLEWAACLVASSVDGTAVESVVRSVALMDEMWEALAAAPTVGTTAV